MDRFKKVYRQGVIDILEVWVDTETGVNYLFKEKGYAGGLTALLDKDGKPVITYNGKEELYIKRGCREMAAIKREE